MSARGAIASVCKFLKEYFADARGVWLKTPKGAPRAMAVEATEFVPKAIAAPVAAPAAKPKGRAKK
jgi:hypothetical protein